MGDAATLAAGVGPALSVRVGVSVGPTLAGTGVTRPERLAPRVRVVVRIGLGAALLLGIAPGFRMIGEFKLIMPILKLLRCLENVFGLQQIERRQLDNLGKEPSVHGVLVAEKEVDVALANQGVQKAV